MADPGPARRRVLLLAGTTEARRLAERCAGRDDVEVVVSLAGRTARPVPLPGTVRIGGFGGPAGLARYLRDEQIALVVDATHPFAARMPHNAAQACAAVGVPRVRLLRPQWRPEAGDRWHPVPDLAAAAGALEELGARRVFLTTGRTNLAPFVALEKVWFLIRSVDAPDPMPLARAEVILDRGPFTEAAERELMVGWRIDVVVTKNSGGPASAKLAAARALGLPVVVVARPVAPVGPTVTGVEEAADWLAAILASPASPGSGAEPARG